LYPHSPLFYPIVRAVVNKRRVAALLKRAPWTGFVAQRVVRFWQPWVTVGAVGAVFNDAGQLLIVEHVFHPIFPWGLPGGWMSRDENPEDTVRRELYEETALRVEVLKLLLIERARGMPRHLDIAYLCYALPGEIRLSGELLASEWIDPLHAPPMADFHTRVVRAALHERASARGGQA
jgi:8-oxo-dGTP diphosphatase